MSGNSPLKIIALGFFFIFSDQVSKYCIQSSLGTTSFFVIPGILAISPTVTSHLFFGVTLPGCLHSVLNFFIIILLIGWVAHKRSTHVRAAENLACVLMIAGATSNMIDRVRWDGVFDWISIPGIGVSNLADAMIIMGAIMFVLNLWRKNV